MIPRWKNIVLMQRKRERGSTSGRNNGKRNRKKTVWLSKVQLEALMLKYKKECI